MKTILSKLAIASAMLAFAVTSAFAETSTAKVPFNFVANGKHCSAGVYTIYRDPRSSTVRMQSADGARNMQWVIMPGAPASIETGPSASLLTAMEPGTHSPSPRRDEMRHAKRRSR